MKLTIEGIRGKKLKILGKTDLLHTNWVATKMGFANKEAIDVKITVNGVISRSVLTTSKGCEGVRMNYIGEAKVGDVVRYDPGQLTVDVF